MEETQRNEAQESQHCDLRGQRAAAGPCAVEDNSAILGKFLIGDLRKTCLGPCAWEATLGLEPSAGFPERFRKSRQGAPGKDGGVQKQPARDSR